MMAGSVLAGAWHSSLGRMLLLSLGLHLAVIMIVQPRPYPPAAEVMVISARLDEEARPESDPVTEVPVPPAPLPVPALGAPEAAPAVSPKGSPPELAPMAVAQAEAPPVARPEPVAEAANPPGQAVTAPPPLHSEARPAPAASLPSLPVMVDTTWYEARQLDTQPRAAAAIQPRYPPGARQRGIEGSVNLRMRIDEFGVVQDVRVEEGDPPGVFDASALEAFRAGRFIPARRDGRSVRAEILVKVRYELGD